VDKLKSFKQFTTIVDYVVKRICHEETAWYSLESILWSFKISA